MSLCVWVCLCVSVCARQTIVVVSFPLHLPHRSYFSTDPRRSTGHRTVPKSELIQASTLTVTALQRQADANSNTCVVSAASSFTHTQTHGHIRVSVR